MLLLRSRRWNPIYIISLSVVTQHAILELSHLLHSEYQQCKHLPFIDGRRLFCLTTVCLDSGLSLLMLSISGFVVFSVTFVSGFVTFSVLSFMGIGR